jgi:hypothetical protein
MCVFLNRACRAWGTLIFTYQVCLRFIRYRVSNMPCIPSWGYTLALKKP